MMDFLNPKSMLTPGIAGALMMFLANALCAVFPEVAFRYVALGLSFVMGLVVFQTGAFRFTEKATYWLLNSLIIFATGVGASNIAANIEQPPRAGMRAAARAALGSLADSLVPDAAAQTGAIVSSSAGTARTPESARSTPSSGRDPRDLGAVRGADEARGAPVGRSAIERRESDERRKEEFFRKERDPRSQGFFRKW